MVASTGKSFGLKLYIHSMTDNIITTSNYTQLQLNELPGYNLNIVESGVKHPKKKIIYRIIICHVRIYIMIIDVPDFLYCCILLIMVLCHGRSLIKKIKQRNNKNRLQNTENKFKKGRKYLH